MLEVLQEQIRNCNACGLCEILPAGCTPVPGEGKTGGIMLVGEAPGETEIEMNKPFIGMSGRLLDKILSDAGINRDDCYVANTVNCRPHNKGENRPPTAKEIKVCKGWLWEQIKLVKPTKIYTLGITPTRTLLRKIIKSTTKMKDIVGKEFSVVYCDAKIIPIYHPSFLLQYGRKYTEETVRIFKNEL